MEKSKQIKTTVAGELTYDIVGNLEGASAVILTVHDLGCNSAAWDHFVCHPSMAEVTKRAVWVHINLPGQQDEASPFPKDYKYPSMDVLADAVGEVCDTIQCPIIGLGEGAGANILARLALKAPKQLHGVVLIHCTSTSAGFLESMQDKAINWKLLGGMNPTAENYLILHRFGDFSHANDAEQVKAVVDEFHQQLNSKMNSSNIRGYIDSFVHRTNIAEKMANLSIPLLLVTGAKASHNHTVHTFFNALVKSVADRKKIEFIEVADIANVVEGAPEKLAESMQYFMQGCGVLAGAPMLHVAGHSKSGTTMQEMDKSDV